MTDIELHPTHPQALADRVARLERLHEQKNASNQSGGTIDELRQRLAKLADCYDFVNKQYDCKVMELNAEREANQQLRDEIERLKAGQEYDITLDPSIMDEDE